MKKIFISYSWADEVVRKWVQEVFVFKLRSKLQNLQGDFMVILDVDEYRPNFRKFIKESSDDNPLIIALCDKQYEEKTRNLNQQGAPLTQERAAYTGKFDLVYEVCEISRKGLINDRNLIVCNVKLETEQTENSFANIPIILNLYKKSGQMGGKNIRTLTAIKEPKLDQKINEVNYANLIEGISTCLNSPPKSPVKKIDRPLNASNSTVVRNIESLKHNYRIQKSLRKKGDEILFKDVLDVVSKHRLKLRDPNWIGGKIYCAPNDKDCNSEHFLNKYIKRITNNDAPKLFFYTGHRGSGKTLRQNVWLYNNFRNNNLESNNIFHVRCDVHKMYEKLFRPGIQPGILSISDYLDMQFLYIYLKRRPVEDGLEKKIPAYNPENEVSPFMRRIEEEVISDLLGNEIDTRGGKISILEWLKNESKKIYDDWHSKPNSYESYAIKLMKDARSSQREQLRTEIRNFLHVYRDPSDTLIENFVGGLSSNSQHDTIQVFKALVQSDEIALDAKIEPLLACFNPTESSEDKKLIMQQWLKVSQLIQGKIINTDYKILYMIDGIDNIMFNDNPIERNHFFAMIANLCNITQKVNNETHQGYYYWITMRDDVYAYFQERAHNYLNSAYYTNGQAVKLSDHEHHPIYDIRSIERKRYRYFKEEIEKAIRSENSVFARILHMVFTKFEGIIHDDIDFFHKNVRAKLRHKLFLSLQVFKTVRTSIHKGSQAYFMAYYSHQIFIISSISFMNSDVFQ
jgi:hypothetical protein